MSFTKSHERLLLRQGGSQAGNKLIAKAFKEAGIIERYGSGIRRILSICNDYGIVPNLLFPFN